VTSATLRAILRAQLALVPDCPPVVWEQSAHTKPASATWLEDELRLPSTTTLASGLTESRGLYLLTLHTPPDRVLRDLDTIADAIAHVFEPGRTLTDHERTHHVELTALDLGAIRRVDTWGYRRLAIGFTALAFRTTLQPA
jgi:hypothetical protein